MSVTIKYTRYGVKGEFQERSLEDAIETAERLIDSNEACPDRIVDEEGKVLWTHPYIEMINKRSKGR